MALDSLGLGLTLDTTLLEKADKTLENMQRNSQLIMQNLNKGFSAFNRGDITDFSKPFDAIKKAMDTIKNSKVSIEFDSAGQDRFLDGLNQIMEQVERIRQIGEVGDNKVRFFDPSEVKVTTESLTELKAKAEEIGTAFKEVQKELSLAFEFGKDVSGNDAKIDKLKNDLLEIGKAAEITTKDFSQMEKELKEIKGIGDAEYESALGEWRKRWDEITNEAKSKNSEITDEELKKIREQDEALNQLKATFDEKRKAMEEASAALTKYSSLYKELSELEAKKEAHDNLQLNRDKEKAYQELLAENRAEQKFAGATTAQQNAMLVSQEQKNLADTNKQVATLTRLYKEATSNLEKYQGELSELLNNIGTVGKKRTTAQNEEVTRLLKEINQARSILNQLRTEAPEVIEKIEAAKQGAKVQKSAAENAEKVRASLDYAKVFSDNAKSIDEEIEAIRMLKQARNALASDTTANYDDEIKEANKRISKHEDHIKLLTQEQKESKTLEDSVISRYLRERKEADKLGDELRELNRVRKERGTDYTPDEKKNIDALISRWRTLRKDIAEIEENNEAHLSQLQEKYASQRAEEEIKTTLATNEREKQEYAKLLDDLYAIEKQKKAMEEAGGGVGDKAYDNLLQQEADLNARKSQLEATHQNDLDEIRKKHAKERNDDEVKAFIAAEKEKLRIAEEYAKKQREKARKYGTISSASADRLIGATDNAKNINQHKRAIEKLTQARASLDNTDKNYLKTVKRLNEAIKYHEIEIELADDKSKKLMQTHRGLMDIGGQLMRRLALVFSVSQLTQYFRKLVEVRGEFEKTEVALTTILKSRAQANVLMNQVTDLAVKSPFTLQQLVGYTKQLAAYQIEYKKLFSTTKMLADVSAGLGVEMDRLILAFGQVRAANFLRATEVRQFTEAGFDILGELAKHYSTLKGEMVSVAEVQEMVTKRMVGFADVEKVFQNVTSAGGIFYDMQAKQAETLAGQWSNLQDKISIMYNEIGKSTDGALKGIVGFLASLIDNWEGAATVLKSVVAAFAMVKINAALTSKETIKFVRSMGLIKGRVKAVSVIQLLGAAFVKLGRSIKTAGVALKAFVVNNPYVAALLALVGVIGAVVSKHRKQEEAVKGVIERYDQLHESITDINASMLNAINEQDLDKQKDSLKELVDMVDKEYNMKVNIDIEDLNPEEIAQKFNEIMDEAERLNIFGELFGSGLEGFKASGMWTNDLLKDVSQYGEAANDLFKQMVDKSNMVASALQEIDAEKYKDIIKDLVAPRDIMGGESELTYLNRLYDAYKKIKEESSIDLSWDEDTDQYVARTSENFYELGKILGEIDFKQLSLDYADALNEFKDVEFINYLNTLEGSLEGLTDEQKEKKLKFAIDTEAANREWNAFVVQMMYEIANTKFGLHIKPEIEAPDVTKWEKWQENYRKEFEKEEGYMRITSPSITQEAQIKALNEEYAKQHDLLERIKNAGGKSALEVGGAYEGLGKTMEEITEEMKDLNAQIVYLGGKNTTLDKGEKASQKILNRRISILKEIHEAYKQGRKDDLGHEEAIQKVMKDWGDTFREAFEGTNINLSSLLVDKEKLQELVESGKESGKVFSDAMLAKMNEVAETGTYIRNISDKAKEQIKLDEGFVGYIYDDAEQAKVKTQISTLEELYKYYDKVTGKAKKVEGQGTLTIGYGHALQTLDEAKEYLGITLEQADAEELLNKDIQGRIAPLNTLLDKYNELIVTQEQYDTLFNNFYQGGLGQALSFAFSDDTSKLEAHIKKLDEDLKSWGSSFAQEWGENWLEEFKQLETHSERFARVLEIASVTTVASGGHIDKNLFYGENAMKARSARRAAEFTGDLEIVKLLEKASQTIADFDFSTPEGLVKALRGLIPIAKEEGKEAMLVLSKEISKVENEIGVRIRLENVEDFKEDIEKTIGDYKQWKDVEKLQMPEDVAIKMFGVTPKTLQQVREEVLGALNLGDDINLGNEEDILAAVKLQYGEPTEKIVRDFFKNVNQIQRNETEEQAKRFVKFLTKNLDQTKVIMSQRGIDIAFAKKQFDEGAISAEQFAETVKNIVAQSNEEISKINLGKFKESPEYLQAMGNLSAYTVEELKTLKTTLDNLISANADAFSVEEMKVYREVLERVVAQIDKYDNNLWFKDEDIYKIKEINRIQGEINDAKEDEAEYNKTLTEQIAERAALEAKLSLLQKQKEDAQKAGQDTTNIDEQILEVANGITEINSPILETEGNIRKTKTLLSELGELLETLTGDATPAMAKLQAGIDIFNKSLALTTEVYGEIKDLAASFGADTESGGWKQAENVMGMLQGFGSNAASAVGKFATGDILGGTIDSVKAIFEVIKGINAIHDDALESQIQDHLDGVESLQRSYKKLEWTVSRAFAIDRYGMVAEQTENIGKQIDNLNSAMSLESDKKNVDEDRLKELKEQAEDAQQQIQELYDNLREEIVGSYEDLSSTLADAMIDALKSGEDALKAWGDAVDEIIGDIVTKLAVQKYVEPQVSRVLDQFYSKTLPKNAAAEKAFQRVQSLEVGTKEYEDALAEWQRLSNEAIGELPQLSEDSVNALRADLEAIGVSFEPIAEAIAGLYDSAESGGLSALQKGIAGLSEETGQVLVAYWNASRQSLSNIDSKMDIILANMGLSSSDENPMLSQLRLMANQTKAINDLLSSVTAQSSGRGGTGIKVYFADSKL